MKYIIQLVLWVVIAFLGFKVYDSVYSSVEFQKTKKERFAEAIDKLKQIRTAQVAHRTVTGKFANSYENLAKFIDTAKFTITQQRDSSFTRFDKVLKIDKSIDTVVVDVLGYESIKDSLFRDIDYRKLEVINVADREVKIGMKTNVIERNEILYPVFQARVLKKDILFDQDPNYIEQEDKAESLGEINGNEISVGSLDEINTNGNWPVSYDN